MELKDVVGFANATKSLLDANGVAVKLYNTVIADPWETATFVPQIAAVNAMSGTDTLIELNAGDTKLRNGYMNNEQSILTDLEFKIKVCRTAGTITDSVASFGLGAFRKSINTHDIGAFHLAYNATMLRIAAGGNTAALNTAGFVGADITSITTNHNLAWNMSTTQITLKTQIHTLSVSNQAIVKTLLKTCAQVIGSIQAYAAKNKNKDLMKKATAVAILGTVTPKQAVEPVDRNIEPNQGICWLKNPVARDLNQLTLLTAGGSATVCRVPTPTSPAVGGTPLVFNTMLSVKKADIPGSGNCIKITNTGAKKIKVRTFRVKG